MFIVDLVFFSDLYAPGTKKPANRFGMRVSLDGAKVYFGR